MTSIDSEPTLDVRALARAGGLVRGAAPLSRFTRLGADAAPVPDDPVLQWEGQGEWRTPLGGSGEVWLHLRLTGQVPLVCQRCMEPVRIPLEVQRSFRFAPDEKQAAAWDEDSEEDVLAISSDFRLSELVEDEALLALPLVPRHGTCPNAPRLQVQDAGFHDDASQPEKPNPFAVLGRLRSPGPEDGQDG